MKEKAVFFPRDSCRSSLSFSGSSLFLAFHSVTYADGAAVIRRVTKKQVDGILPDDHLFSLEVSCYILLQFKNNITLYAMCKDIS